ncbi:MAG: hypothetical protein R3293_24005 [Candidatus Promineifilaceae bacterium]|nr:hypothetical protein [Candidatus Promineifilaceae bacterium]
MKLLMLIALTGVVVGGIYHTEVSRYFSNLAEESSYSGGVTSSTMGSMQGMGKSSRNLIGGVGGALR